MRGVGGGGSTGLNESCEDKTLWIGGGVAGGD